MKFLFGILVKPDSSGHIQAMIVRQAIVVLLSIKWYLLAVE